MKFLKMRKKYSNLIECPCAKTKKLDRLLSRGYDQTLKELGLTVAQFSMLRVLERVGPISISKLAEIFCMDRTTLSRNLKLPQKNGWIAISRGFDARSRMISNTPKGRELHESAKILWEIEQKKVYLILGEEKFNILNVTIDESIMLLEASLKRV